MRLLTPGPAPFQAEVPMKATSHTDPDFRKTMKRLQEAVLARLEASGFRVAPGIGPTAGKAVRVGLFGSQAEAVQDLVEALLGVGA